MRHDAYFFFAEDLLQMPPAMVEVGAFNGEHYRRLHQAYQGTVVAYEASTANFLTLQKAIGDTPIIAHNQAVTGKPGEVASYEFRNRPESNSVMARELEVECVYSVEAVDLTGVLAANQLERIDVLFSNGEGGELGLLEEILAKPDLWARFGPMCISFHPQIYGQRTGNRMLDRLAPRAEIIKDVDNDWPCHLFINRDLLTQACTAAATIATHEPPP